MLCTAIMEGSSARNRLKENCHELMMPVVSFPEMNALSASWVAVDRGRMHLLDLKCKPTILKNTRMAFM